MFNNQFKYRSEKKELIDEALIPHEMLIQNLKEFEKINKFLGSKNLLIKSLNKVYLDFIRDSIQKKIIIADIGCGGGDLLVSMAKWCNEKNIDSNLIGFDINTDIINYAKHYSSVQGYNNIRYQAVDLFSEHFESNNFDIVSLNNVCHHFTDMEFVAAFKKLKKQTKIAIIVNDLHRHVIPYHGIKLITQGLNLSKLACHDGPLSVLRGFKKKELMDLIHSSEFANFEIHWAWPFHWQIIIWCK